jgi:hypothetical protein
VIRHAEDAVRAGTLMSLRADRRGCCSGKARSGDGGRGTVALTGLSSRTVTETSAPPRIAALIVGCPKNAESARINGLSGALEARKREEKLRRSA